MFKSLSINDRAQFVDFNAASSPRYLCGLKRSKLLPKPPDVGHAQALKLPLKHSGN